MWQRLAILIGGYVFIAMSYLWVWAIATGLSRPVDTDPPSRITKSDVMTVLSVMAFWTIAWAFMQIVEVFE